MKDDPNFLYDVATSATGFLFSLALAVGIFYLQRWYTAKDRAKTALEDQRATVRGEFAYTVRAFNRIHPAIMICVLWSGALDWRVVQFKFELLRLVHRTDEEPLKEFCYHYSEGLTELTKRRRGIPFVQAFRRTIRVVLLAANADESLTKFLRHGGTIDLRAFDAARDGHGGKALEKFQVERVA